MFYFSSSSALLRVLLFVTEMTKSPQRRCTARSFVCLPAPLVSPVIFLSLSLRLPARRCCVSDAVILLPTSAYLVFCQQISPSLTYYSTNSRLWSPKAMWSTNLPSFTANSVFSPNLQLKPDCSEGCQFFFLMCSLSSQLFVESSLKTWPHVISQVSLIAVKHWIQPALTCLYSSLRGACIS